MNEFNIYSDTFRGARQVAYLIETLAERANIPCKTIKRGDCFIYEIGDFKFYFRPMLPEIVEKYKIKENE